jgi:hypothetical protein
MIHQKLQSSLKTDFSSHVTVLLLQFELIFPKISLRTMFWLEFYFGSYPLILNQLIIVYLQRWHKRLAKRNLVRSL